MLPRKRHKYHGPATRSLFETQVNVPDEYIQYMWLKKYTPKAAPGFVGGILAVQRYKPGEPNVLSKTLPKGEKVVPAAPCRRSRAHGRACDSAPLPAAWTAPWCPVPCPAALEKGPDRCSLARCGVAARAARRPRFAPLAQIVHGPFSRPQVPMHFSTTGGVWEGLPFEVP